MSEKLIILAESHKYKHSDFLSSIMSSMNLLSEFKGEEFVLPDGFVITREMMNEFINSDERYKDEHVLKLFGDRPNIDSGAFWFGDIDAYADDRSNYISDRIDWKGNKEFFDALVSGHVANIEGEGERRSSMTRGLTKYQEQLLFDIDLSKGQSDEYKKYITQLVLDSDLEFGKRQGLYGDGREKLLDIKMGMFENVVTAGDILKMSTQYLNRSYAMDSRYHRAYANQVDDNNYRRLTDMYFEDNEDTSMAIELARNLYNQTSMNSKFKTKGYSYNFRNLMHGVPKNYRPIVLDNLISLNTKEAKIRNMLRTAGADGFRGSDLQTGFNKNLETENVDEYINRILNYIPPTQNLSVLGIPTEDKDILTNHLLDFYKLDTHYKTVFNYRDGEFLDQAKYIKRHYGHIADIEVYPMMGFDELNNISHYLGNKYQGQDINIAILGHAGGSRYGGVNYLANDFRKSVEDYTTRFPNADLSEISAEFLSTQVGTIHPYYTPNPKSYREYESGENFQNAVSPIRTKCNVKDVYLGSCAMGDDTVSLAMLNGAFGAETTWGQEDAKWGSASMPSPDSLSVDSDIADFIFTKGADVAGMTYPEWNLPVNAPDANLLDVEVADNTTARDVWEDVQGHARDRYESALSALSRLTGYGERPTNPRANAPRQGIRRGEGG